MVTFHVLCPYNKENIDAELPQLDVSAEIVTFPEFLQNTESGFYTVNLSSNIKFVAIVGRGLV